MTKLRLRFFTAAILALAFTGCIPRYATVREKRATYQPITQVGQFLVKVLRMERSHPEEAIGKYLDAASVAAVELKRNPNDATALKDYNFAVSSVFNVLYTAKLQPWINPMQAPGAEAMWTLQAKPSAKGKLAAPAADLSYFNVLPADRYEFKGTAIKQRTIKAGLGAPLIAASNNWDFTKVDRFAQAKDVYLGLTAVIRFEGNKAIIALEDPLSTEDTTFQGRTYPLAADFTAPLALALSKDDPRKFEIARMFYPQKYAETARLARLQPYLPKKIPVVVVHGLLSSPATWVPLINALRGDPEIRKHYQFWFYSYPTGYPYPHSAAIMRRQLDDISKHYANHEKIVLIGHSMGGIISRTMLVDSDLKLWNEFFNCKPEDAELSEEALKTFSDALIFKHRKDVGRAIFIAAPHRGTDFALNWIGRLGAKLVRAPQTMIRIAQEAQKYITLDSTSLRMGRIPNSVDTLSPKNKFVLAINQLPMTKTIPFHSIMGDRGKGGNRDRTPPVSTDGLVPYWSSHLDGAASELVVPSGHSANENPQCIEEVRRILILHARSAKRSKR